MLRVYVGTQHLECIASYDTLASPFCLLVRCILSFPDGPNNVTDQSCGHGIDDRSSGGIDFGVRSTLGIGHEEGVSQREMNPQTV